ncbi:MAG: desulfoferrodoxin [Clostridia bacterium]|nr:desulfoferrodoxin [Clostridia bacterium]
MKLKVFKCNKCGAVVLNFDESETLECCDNEMIEQVPNSVDASFEKHLPIYIKEGDKLIAEVPHVMEEEHYIEWIMALTEQGYEMRDLEPGMEAKVEFEADGVKELYAYCNKHGLWKTIVE